ncbi:MAG: M20/M25/M40 family metallo-hydrolase, partial [Gemmatimonadota bacterium]
MTLDPALAVWFDTHDQRLHDDLFAFLRIPSVSARSEHAGDGAAAAAWLHGHLARIGFTVETHPTAGHPVVLAEWRKAPPGAPTILVYGHYDVQPPEPLELWTSPAFEPAIRDGNIYARGSVDDKGQLWLHVAALEAHLATRGTLPVNIIVLAEGEEEVGSEHLAPFIAAHRDRLACDGVVIS